MKVYTITGFQGHYPVGTAAVVVAENKNRALELLNEALAYKCLPLIESPDELIQLDLDDESVSILCDGDY